MAAASDPVVIVSAVRTPLGRFMGELSPFSAKKHATHLLAALLERCEVSPDRSVAVLMG